MTRALAHRHVRVEDGVVPDAGAAAYHDVGVQNHPVTDAGARGDHHEWADADVRANDASAGNDAGRMHTRRRHSVSGEQLERLREGEIGVGRAERGHGGGGHASADDDCGRPRRLQRCGVSRVGKEADVAGAGRLEPGDAGNLDGAIALQAAAQALSELAQCHGDRPGRRGRARGTAPRSTMSVTRSEPPADRRTWRAVPAATARQSR